MGIEVIAVLRTIVDFRKATVVVGELLVKNMWFECCPENEDEHTWEITIRETKDAPEGCTWEAGSY